MKYIVVIKIVFFFTINLLAREDAAIANYKKSCKKCHGSAYYVAKIRTSEEWEELFNDNGKKLFLAHQNDKKAIKKLSSSYYKKRLEYLKVFLMNNGEDMGTVPPCNSTTCGFNVKLFKKDKSESKKSLFKKAL